VESMTWAGLIPEPSSRTSVVAATDAGLGVAVDHRAAMNFRIFRSCSQLCSAADRRSRKRCLYGLRSKYGCLFREIADGAGNQSDDNSRFDKPAGSLDSNPHRGLKHFAFSVRDQ
jgi:hypothetical protein